MKTSVKTIILENIAMISENKRTFSLKKFLDNWLVLIFISVGFLTAKVAAEQLAMYAKKNVEFTDGR